MHALPGMTVSGRLAESRRDTLSAPEEGEPGQEG